jgi:hypothetical protein
VTDSTFRNEMPVYFDRDSESQFLHQCKDRKKRSKRKKERITDRQKDRRNVRIKGVVDPETGKPTSVSLISARPPFIKHNFLKLNLLKYLIYYYSIELIYISDKLLSLENNLESYNNTKSLHQKDVVFILCMYFLN